MNQMLLETNLNTYINDFSISETSLNTSATTNTTSTLCSLTKIDQSSLLTNKIKYLEEELSNAQADKEFVWSLWKQLQSTSPDVTSAISQVVQREKEKAEIKDRKVLEILKIKDRKLEENDKLISELNSELSSLQNRVKNLELETISKNEEVDLLKKNIKTSEDKEQMYEQIIRLRDDKMEKMVKESEQEKIYLMNRVRDLTEETETLKIEVARKVSELDVRSLELKTVNENYEKLLIELNHFRESIDQTLKAENDKLRIEVKQKNENFDKLKSELEQVNIKLNSNIDCLNQQDKLIKQLKQIQNDQQNTIQTQKNTYDILDAENLTIKKMYDDLLRKFEAFVKQDKSAKLISDVEALETKDKINKDLIKTKNNEIEKLKIECAMHKEKLSYAESIVNELNKKCQILAEENEWKQKEVDKKLKAQPKQIKRSKSQNTRNSTNAEESSHSDREISKESAIEIRRFYENLCQVKDKEFATLKTAHQRRLDKILSLEKENQLLKKQIELNDEEEEKMETKKCVKASGYKRADTQLLTKELTSLKHENEGLERENFRLKETLDDLKLKLEEQNEQIQSLNFELNFNSKDKEKHLQAKHDIFEKNLHEKRELCLRLETEVTNLKHLCNDLDAKCTNLTQDRDKYLNLSNKLMNENKKMYKKWFDLRKKENKFRLVLNQQVRKYSQDNKKQKIDSNNHQENKIEKKQVNKNDEKSAVSQLKSKNLKLQLVKKQNDELIKQKECLEVKIKNFKDHNDKLMKEIEVLETKLKSSKLQVESLGNEVNSFKKRESECRESELNTLKKEQQLREDIKKQMENKNRQLNTEISRQLSINKTLRSENDKLGDRLKVNEEKINHLERDNNQKKQLVEFYKKKLEENQIKSDPIVNFANEQISNEFKSQVKKLSEMVEKYKAEVKNVRLSLQSVQNERQRLEEKLEKSEKNANTFKDKVSGLKKQKIDLEAQLKNEHNRVLTLESLINELESTAQNKLKTLSQASHETLNMAQLRVKYAFKLAEGLENLIKNLYESLINRIRFNRKAILNEKKTKKDMLNNDMKFALDLASSVLNMSQDELDDLLHVKEDKKDDGQKLMFELEQCLNTGKKEVNETSDDFNLVNIDKVCELITTRLDELLGLEKELNTLKNS